MHLRSPGVGARKTMNRARILVNGCAIHPMMLPEGRWKGDRIQDDACGFAPGTCVSLTSDAVIQMTR